MARAKLTEETKEQKVARARMVALETLKGVKGQLVPTLRTKQASRFPIPGKEEVSFRGEEFTYILKNIENEPKLLLTLEESWGYNSDGNQWLLTDASATISIDGKEMLRLEAHSTGGIDDDWHWHVLNDKCLTKAHMLAACELRKDNYEDDCFQRALKRYLQEEHWHAILKKGR